MMAVLDSGVMLPYLPSLLLATLSVDPSGQTNREIFLVVGDIAFDIDQGAAVTGVDVGHIDTIFSDVQHMAAGHGDQVGPHRSVGSEDAGEWILRVFAGVNLQRGALPRRVVFMKPLKDVDVLKTV